MIIKKNSKSELELLVNAINAGELHKIIALYNKQAVLIPIIKQSTIRGIDNICNHYEHVLQNNDFKIDIIDSNVEHDKGNKTINSTCLATWIDEGTQQHMKSKVTLLLQNDKILIHHSSEYLPT